MAKKIDKLKLSAKERERIDIELKGKQVEKAGEGVQSQDARDLVNLAVKRYEKYNDEYSDEIVKAKDDIKFCDGEHWTTDEKTIRDADGRLSYVKNRAPSFIDNVTGDVRQNMPRIKFRPVDSKTDPKMAEIYNSAISYMHSISRAHRQYIPAFEQGCTGGYPGWVQMITDYVDNESDEQDIFVRFIPNQFGPALDHTALCLDEPGKGGPKWGIIPEQMTWADYNDLYPEASAKTWDAVKDTGNTWYKQDGVTVASYYNAIPEQDSRYTFEGGVKLRKSRDNYKEFIEKNPDAKPIGERKLIKWHIDHYIINGSEILRGPEVWPGKYVPLIPFEGKWFMDNGKKKYRSVYREAKDTNRQENFFASTITELLADEPYIADPDMVSDHKKMWESRNKKKYGVLYAKYINGQRPEKEDNSQKLQGSFNMIRQLIDDEKDLTNIWNASLGKQGNETSGRAINARDAQSNTTNFAFVDNGIIAPLEYIAMQFIDLFPKVYDYEKTLKIIGEDETDNGEVTLNAVEPDMGQEGIEQKTMHVIKDKEGNIVKKLYANLSDVKFNITVDVGPGLKTQRMEALTNIVEMSKGNPIFAEASVGQAAKMLDMIDAEKIAKRSEFILNMKYPGIDQVGDDDPGNKMQNAIKQAVNQVEQEAMQAYQAAEAKITELTQALQAEQQTRMQSEQKVLDATKAMKDATTKFEQRERENALNLREHTLDMREKGLYEKAISETEEGGEKTEGGEGKISTAAGEILLAISQLKQPRTRTITTPEGRQYVMTESQG